MTTSKLDLDVCARVLAEQRPRPGAVRRYGIALVHEARASREEIAKLQDGLRQAVADAERFSAETLAMFEKHHAEVVTLRAALIECFVFEVVSFQPEFECTLRLSEGWHCHGCEEAGDRPLFAEKADVVHVAPCVLAGGGA